MHADDQSVNDAATSMLNRVAAATALTVVALLVGIGAAATGGAAGNVVLAIIGGIASSALLGIVVLRYRRENWRIRAEQIAPMIWQHGV